MTRFLLHLIIAFLFIYGPWWLVALCVLFGFFVYESFYEGIVWGALFDGVYGSTYTVQSFFSSFLFFSFTSFIALQIIRPRLRFYRN